MLVVTAMYPHAHNVTEGVFVKDQVDSLLAADPRVGVDVLQLRGHRQLRYLWGGAQVLLATTRKRYDIVHAHYGLAALAAIVRWRVPLVVTLHGSDVNIPWQRFVSRFACRFARSVIVVSQEMRGLLGLPTAHVIPAGIDLTLFRELDQNVCRRTLGLPLDARIVLFPADPRRQVKRFDLFLRAMDMLQSFGLQVRYVTLPAGRYRHEQMPTLLNACDLLVLTSNTEGSPMVIKEAMACNLPIVSVRVGDVAEIIGDTEGCYIASRNPEDIAWKAGLALERGGRTRGRERVYSLSDAAVARRIMEVYAGAIGGSGQVLTGYRSTS